MSAAVASPATYTIAKAAATRRAELYVRFALQARAAGDIDLAESMEREAGASLAVAAKCDRSTARAQARKHNATLGNGNPIGLCGCGECTRLDWQATPDDEMGLAEYRRTFYPEAWA